MTPHGSDPTSQTPLQAKRQTGPPASEGSAPPSASTSATPSRLRVMSAPNPRLGRRWSLSRTVTHPVVTAGLASIGLSIICWSMLFRLPDDDSIRPVYASSTMIRLPDLGRNKTALNEEAIEQLRQQVQAARSYLVQNHDELVKLVAETERLAMESGWRAEVSLKPPLPAPADLDRAQWHPAEVLLTNLEGNSPQRRAYRRLLDFMHQVKALGKKMELTGLNLKAGPEGLQSAQAQIVIWSVLFDENPAAR